MDINTIKACIEAIAEQRGLMDGRAEQAARRDRYADAAEFQTLARGMGMAATRLEEIIKEEKP